MSFIPVYLNPQEPFHTGSRSPRGTPAYCRQQLLHQITFSPRSRVVEALALIPWVCFSSEMLIVLYCTLIIPMNL